MKTWTEAQRNFGLPPWLTPDGADPLVLPDTTRTLASSKSLRAWADEYCASPKRLKEFVFTKVRFFLFLLVPNLMSITNVGCPRLELFRPPRRHPLHHLQRLPIPP